MRLAQQKNRRSYMIRSPPGSVGIPIRLALLPADVPGLYPRGGSSHGTAEGKPCQPDGRGVPRPWRAHKVRQAASGQAAAESVSGSTRRPTRRTGKVR
jgi:hypothetical protein